MSELTHKTLASLFDDTADAIREKLGTEDTIIPDVFPNKIRSIPSGGTYQDKTITPTENRQIVSADSDYDALSSVTVEAIPSNYVGSGIARKSSTDLTVNGATVTAPAGYYATDASQSVASGSVTVATPTISSSGLITASASVVAGYISSNPANKTLQLTTQAAKTVTPSTSVQTAVGSGIYTTGDITVAAMPNGSLDTPEVNSSGLVTASIGTSGYLASGTSKTLQLTTQAAKTVTPSTSQQTAVTSGRYTTGDITVAAMPSGVLGTPSIDSSGLVTCAVSTSGYLASGTSKTLQLTTQAAKTITPSSSSQTAVASGRYTTGAVAVSAVPTETQTATQNGTVTPSSGKFLSSVIVALPVYDGRVG